MLTTRDLTPTIGTEISTNVETLLTGAKTGEIRELLSLRGVLVFRELNLTNPQQLEFARTLGEILPQGDDGIFKVTLDKGENADANYLRGSFFWHIDGAMDDVPTRASLLSARRLSEMGGETQFANTYAAFDALSEEERHSYENLRVVHLFENSQRMVSPEHSFDELLSWRKIRAPKTHPLVWTHQSGRKSFVLGASASHIEGMDYCEGRDLLCRLRDWATQDRFVYRHDWRLGDLIIWDNTGAMHRVTPYALDSGRMMHRTTLVGEEVLA